MQALELIKQHFPDVPVSLMSQYTPMGRVLHEPEFADINRRITLRESRKVQNYMLELGLPGFCQKRSGRPANVIYRILHSLTRST